MRFCIRLFFRMTVFYQNSNIVCFCVILTVAGIFVFVLFCNGYFSYKKELKNIENESIFIKKNLKEKLYRVTMTMYICV